ncbi:MAG TPA: hypothetical protein GX719_07730 [Gammaproteobacteria bacterium]|nr:hypothetical protein [Gammaproteobacteria bacterium]
MKPAPVNTTANKPSAPASKSSWLKRCLGACLVLLLLLICAVLALPHALPWLLQKQGIDFHWQNPQWRYNGFSVSQLRLTLPRADAQSQYLQLDNLHIQWAWHAFPIQHLEASRLKASWPITNNETADSEQNLEIPAGLLKWLPQHIELHEIDADLAGLGDLQGTLKLQASAQGKLWQPSFIHSQLTLKDLQGSWLDSIPTEFQPTQFSAQITTHPDHQDTPDGQQLLIFDLHSEGPARLQLNGLLDLQQTPDWQGTVKNAQLVASLDAFAHPFLVAEQLQARLYFEAHADSEQFTLNLNQHSNLEAHRLQIAGSADAQKIAIQLADLSIQGLNSAPRELQVYSPFNVQIEQLSAEQLHTQDWNLSGTLSGQLSQLELISRLTGEYGLTLTSRIHRHDSAMHGNVSFEDILFKAGNPLQKTFTDWPAAIAIQSGQLRSTIDFNLADSEPASFALQLSASELNANFDSSRLKNLGFEFSSQLNLQLAPTWQANLSNAQLLVQLDKLTDPTLSAEQLQARAYFKAQADAETFTVNFDKQTNLDAHRLQLPDIGSVQQLALQLADLKLQGRSNQPYQIEVRSPFTAHLKNLSAEQLHSQDWDFNGTLTGQLPRLELNGNLSGQQGLNFTSRIRLLDNSIQGSATLKDVFFKAGNPLQKTFKDWPELVSFNSGRLRSQIDFTLPYSAPFTLSLTGSASGLNGIINRSELKNLALDFNGKLLGDALSLGVPSLSVEHLDPGVPVTLIQLTNANYHTTLSDPLQGVADWQNIEAHLLNGRIWLAAQQLDLSRKQKLLLQLEGLELQELFRVYPAEGLAGSGIIDGQLPLYIEHDTIYIEAGQLQAREPGVLQFQSEKIQALGQSNPAMRIVADALDDFHFNLLSSGLSYDQSGKLMLNVILEGRNPDVEKGRPIHLNINLEEDIPALLASIQLSGQVSEIIQKRVRERLEKR